MSPVRRHDTSLAMNADCQHPIVRLAQSALAGWLGLATAWAIYVFALPHDSHFAPEVGPFGAFVIFGAVYSFFYLLDFVLLAVPCFFIFRNRTPSRPLHRAICGAALFCLSVPLWSLASGSFRGREVLVCMVLATIAGAASFVILRPFTSTANAAK